VSCLLARLFKIFITHKTQRKIRLPNILVASVLLFPVVVYSIVATCVPSLYYTGNKCTYELAPFAIVLTFALVYFVLMIVLIVLTRRYVMVANINVYH